MEFDRLNSVGYNTAPVADYSATGAASATVEKRDANGPKAVSANQNIPVSGSEGAVDIKDKPTSAESLKHELTELQETISNEFFDKFIQEANKRIFSLNRQFSYSIHSATNRVTVKVLDRVSKEVIREIPPEKTLDAAAKMLELVGVLFDERI